MNFTKGRKRPEFVYIVKFNSTLSSPSVALLTPCDVGLSYRCSEHWYHLLMIAGQCSRGVKWFEIFYRKKRDTLSFLIILKSEFPNGFICWLNTIIVLRINEKGCGPLTAGEDHTVNKSKKKKEKTWWFCSTKILIFKVL
jgi:hypothetical protein